MTDPLPQEPAKTPTKPLRRPDAPKKPSRAYKDRYEALQSKQAQTELRVQIALSLLRPSEGEEWSCEGAVLKKVVALLEGK